MVQGQPSWLPFLRFVEVSAILSGGFIAAKHLLLFSHRWRRALALRILKQK
jgi:hypothetical protein